MKKDKLAIQKNKEEIIGIISKIISKGSNYIIRAMPVNEHIKDILSDVKEALDEGEFKDALKVAVSSSITEGIEIVGIREDELENIDKMIEIAFEGGLAKSINLGIDMVENVKKYGHLFYNYIEDYFENLKGFVLSKDFKAKVYTGITKCLDKVETFKDMCNEWYDAYDKFNLGDIKDIAGKLKKMKKNVSFDNSCISENTIIQNVTELVARKNKKLTKTQFDICSNLEKL